MSLIRNINFVLERQKQKCKKNTHLYKIVVFFLQLTYNMYRKGDIMLKKIKLDNYTTFIKPTEIDFSATNYKFLENENVGRNRVLRMFVCWRKCLRKNENIKKYYLVT